MQSPLNLSNILEPSQAIAGAAAGVTELDGAVIDMAGYEGCLIVVKLGDVTDTATLALKAMVGDQSGGGDMADLTGATTGTLTAGATNFDGKFLFLDVVKPVNKRYLKGYLTRDVANSVIESFMYFRYGRKLNPTPKANVMTPTVYNAA